MQHYTKQKPSNKSLTINVACIVVAAFSLAFAIGERTNANMVQYAAQNDCEWVYHGTMYGDDRDQTCK